MAQPLSLSGKQSRFLRALAHDLKPVVQVGKKGWSDTMCREIDTALLAHELIKVRLTGETPVLVKDLAAHITAQIDGTVVQILGNTLTVYRPPPQNRPAKIQLPQKSKAASVKKHTF